MAVASACTDEDPGGPEQPDLWAGVLTAEDLPAEPESTEVVDELDSLWYPECALTEGPFHADEGMDSQIVSYDVGGETIASAVSVPNELYGAGDPDPSVEADLKAYGAAVQRCQASGAADLTILDLGKGRFGYEAFDKDGSSRGSEGYAVVNDRVVEVSVVPDTPDESSDSDLDALLTKAVERAG